MVRNTLCWLAATSFLLLGLTGLQADSNWPRWRGPRGDGHSEESGFPEKWDANSITWQVKLPGKGQSSPIIWGERMFLTTALENGAERIVLCVDRNNGEILWQQTAWTGTPEPSHKMNGWASASCVTDGERVYAFFGRGGGLFCYTVDGELVWKKDLGFFESPWGTSACPLLVDDIVIQNCDSDANAYIIGLDKRTGEQVWKTARKDIRGWSSPILVKVEDHLEVVVNGHHGPQAYDPYTGKELWYCKSFNGRGSPTVTPTGKGLLVTVNGLKGDIYAVRPGGTGVVTDTHMAWHTPRGGGRDLPSPIVIDDYVIVPNMQGVATCYDATDGKQIWQERINGNYSAALTACDGKAYCISENGETVVIKPGSELNIVARNDLGAEESEIFRSSITPSDGQLFIRSDSKLYCIGKRKSTN